MTDSEFAAIKSELEKWADFDVLRLRVVIEEVFAKKMERYIERESTLRRQEAVLPASDRLWS